MGPARAQITIDTKTPKTVEKFRKSFMLSLCRRERFSHSGLNFSNSMALCSTEPEPDPSENVDRDCLLSLKVESATAFSTSCGASRKMAVVFMLADERSEINSLKERLRRLDLKCRELELAAELALSNACRCAISFSMLVCIEEPSGGNIPSEDSSARKFRATLEIKRRAV